MQGIQHQPVTAKRDDDLGFLDRDVSVQVLEARLGGFRLRTGAG
ncbi:MAG: hypothetical protein ACJAU5_001496 [Maricaulis maris]